ncbi:Hpt domain-containing protein [Verrucomicrobiota bacterium]
MDGKILLADTDENILSILSDELAEKGFEVVAARTNEECMTVAIGGPIKLALISLDFPGMSDGSLSNLLHVTSSPNLPIIGLADPECADHAPGLTTVLLKPLDREVLRQTLEDLLGHSEKPEPDTEAAPVNLDILMEAACDEHDLAIELIHLFFETTAESCDRLKNAIAANDAKEISEASHKCCGASASCGMIELERRMRTIENMGKENQLNEVQSACDDMLQELERCRLFLEKKFNITIT